MKYNICCSCRKASKEFESNNVGQMMKATGFMPVFINDGGLHWLCETCFPKAQDLAKQLTVMIGSESFYVKSLLKEKE